MTDRAPRQTSVVIPCYNAASFVCDAIASCFAEGVEGSRIIVIDDGSTDETPRRLADWATHIKVRRKANGGASTARNAGLTLVETPYVVFLDADDLYEGGILGALEREMIKTNADIGLGALQNVRTDGSYGRRERPPAPKDPKVFLEAWLRGHTVGTNSQMWRTDFLRHIGGYTTEMKTLEEIQVVARGVLAGAQLAVTDVGQSLYMDRGNTDRVRYGDSEQVIRSAIRGFMQIEPAIKSCEQRIALGQRYYHQARAAFRQGYVSLGRDALSRARTCGFRGHLGTRNHRLLCSLIGLEIKEGLLRRARS